ncbi:hypothetical protein GOP47_0010786 [Adiantum capillus-veneris]|uniref:Uncharacterized protein n=1 Tax=Adiantum capillus-veneris TaxID=13818 RepID=A0A9D4UVY4_ADICA|nr:hypothetical protein GOP47_0010786 [Adiantum capillus-veneris]
MELKARLELQDTTIQRLRETPRAVRGRPEDNSREVQALEEQIKGLQHSLKSEQQQRTLLAEDFVREEEKLKANNEELSQQLAELQELLVDNAATATQKEVDVQRHLQELQAEPSTGETEMSAQTEHMQIPEGAEDPKPIEEEMQ